MGSKQINKYYGRTHRCERFQQCLREYQREMSIDRIIIVAVRCLSCGVIVPTNTLIKQLCPACRRLMYQTIPRGVKTGLARHPSFKECPSMLLQWKRVIDFRRYKRDNNIKRMMMETRLRR